MNKYFKLLNEKFSRIMEEDEKDSDLLSSGENDLLSAVDLKDFTQEATKVIEDGNWEIWKPKSEQGMVLLSQGTKWLASHSWNAPDAEFGEVNPESWNFQNWGKAYVIISKDKIDRVTGFPKKFLFQAGWGGMYSPSYARYSFASWLIKLNSPKLIKWAAQSKFSFVSNRLLSIVATDELKKSGGVYTYPSEVYPSWGERGNVTKIIIKPGTTRINAHAFNNFRSITEVEIPDTVTVISNFAFSRMGRLDSIKLPPNLTTIGEGAFVDCVNLTTIIIPDKVRKISDSAFAGCSSLKTLFIPKSVKTMGIILKQWSRETTLPNLTIYCEAPSKPEGWDENWNATYAGESWDPNTRTWSITDVNKVEKVIWGASKPTVTEEVKKNINEEDGEDEILLTTVSDRKVLLDTPKWKVVRVLSPEAYKEFIKKDNVAIQGILNHLLSVDAEAFFNRTRGVALYVLIDKQNDDRYLFIPKIYGYTILGYDEYNENIMDFLRNIGTDESLQNWFKRTFTATTRNIQKLQDTQAEVTKRKYAYVYPDDEPIDKRDVAEQIKIVTITEGTTEIEDYAFDNFKGVKEIIIPKSVKKIGRYAFVSCNSLISIVIPEGVTKIEENTFWGCHRLEKVTLPNTITEISDSAFWSCDKLWEINIPRSVTKIGDAAFLGCHTLPELFIPASVQTIGTQGLEIRNSYYDTAGYGKATIYCEAQSKPAGWHKDWTTSEVEVVWGARKPGITEEVEEGGYLLSLVKDEKVLYEDSEWKIVKALTFENVVKYAKSTKNAIRWGLSFLDYGFWTGDRDWIELSDKDKLLKLSDVFYNQFEDESQKPRRKKPNFIMIDKLNSNNYLFYDDGGILKNVVGTDLRIKPTYFDEFIKGKNKNLQNWLKGKFPSLEASIGFAKLKEDNINEEVEEGGNYLSLVKSEKVLYEDSEWKIVRPIIFDKLIEYAKSEKTGKSWAVKILKEETSYVLATYDIESVELYFYDETQKKFPYVIILNKKNKKNYLFFFTGINFYKFSLINTNDEELDFISFINRAGVEFQNFFKRHFKSLDYTIDSIQQKQKVLKEYGGVYEYPNTEKIKDNAAPYYTKIIIKEGTNKIEDYAFRSFFNVKSVEIPESVSVIGEGAFVNMKKLSNIFLPKNVKIIGKAAFGGCSSLKKIMCEANSKPEGWDKDWDMYYTWGTWGENGKHKAKIIWGAKPSLKEEIELETVPYVNSEFLDDHWLVMNIKTPAGIVKLPGGNENMLDWKPDSFALDKNKEGYVIFNMHAFYFGTYGIEFGTGVFLPKKIYLYNPESPKELTLLDKGWSPKVLPLKDFLGELKPKTLKRWFTKKFPGLLKLLKEEKEIDLEVMPYAKPEFEADGWVVMSIGTRAAPVELANGKIFNWDPTRYTNEQNEEPLTDGGYVFFSLKSNGATVEDIYLYEPMYPNDINIYQGGSVPMSNLLNYAESDKLRKWVINKFPEYKDDMIEHMVGYMVF